MDIENSTEPLGGNGQSPEGDPSDQGGQPATHGVDAGQSPEGDPARSSEFYYEGKYGQFKTQDDFETHHSSLLSKMNEQGESLGTLKEENETWRNSFQEMRPYMEKLQANPQLRQMVLYGQTPEGYGDDVTPERKMIVDIEQRYQKENSMLKEQLEKLQQTSSQTQESQEWTQFHSGRDALDKEVVGRHESELKNFRRKNPTLSYEQAYKLVVPENEQLEVIRKRQESQNRRKQDATLGYSRSGGQPGRKKVSSVEEALNMAVSMRG